MLILSLLIGLAAGFFAGWFFAQAKSSKGLPPEEVQANYVPAALHESVKAEREKQELATTRAEEENKLLSRQLAAAEEQLRGQALRMKELQEEQQQFKSRFESEFKVLADSILKEQSKTFTQQNKEQLEVVLNPMREKLKEFEDKVQQNYEKEQKERITLKTEVSQLIKMNERLSEEANNLVKALKGDVKAQGNWGEIILERLLERSGLQRDREFFIQESITTEEGKRYQPDVVIHLPDAKRIIVDSKVSLVAYERYTSSEEDADREAALKLHLASIRQHIKLLADKNYQHLYGIEQLDFVLLFIPIEPAFALATQADGNLFNEAFDRNIVLVTPSTLLATLRTIASIWKNEYQNRNALQIAEEGAKMYDKLVNLTEDLIKLGNQFQTAQKTYEGAMNKLSQGSGNLLRRSQQMKQLGVKASKDFDARLLERMDQTDLEHD